MDLVGDKLRRSKDRKEVMNGGRIAERYLKELRLKDNNIVEGLKAGDKFMR